MRSTTPSFRRSAKPPFPDFDPAAFVREAMSHFPRLQRRAVVVMGTIVAIDWPVDASGDAVDRAFDWFTHVESICSRFDPASELAQLCDQIGRPIAVSPLLFEALQFALHVAELTGGAFDPTVGALLSERGFDHEHRTRQRLVGAVPGATGCTWRDVSIDATRREVTIERPLMLDLGAVAKGLAIDLAARELAVLERFVIDAGGDLYCGGTSPDETLWKVGIRHPNGTGVIEHVRVADAAVCSSGNYERLSGSGGKGHIVTPASGQPADLLLGATVISGSAMVADALATAAFVLGAVEGLALAKSQGADAILYGPGCVRHATPTAGCADFRTRGR
jgi:thiamine biosynthesis lipoprotein